MLYFLQTAISEKKHLKKGLQSIYGIGETSALNHLKSYGLNKDVKGKDLRRLHRLYLKSKFEDLIFELGSDLKQETKIKCARLIEIRSYKGRRHKNGYPLRGQRTHTNAKTQKRLYKRWITTSHEKPKSLASNTALKK